MELEAAKSPLVGAERGGDASELAITLNLVTACPCGGVGPQIRGSLQFAMR